MELEYPNRIYPISDIKRRFWTLRLLEVPPPPPSNTLRGRMCVPIFSGKGVRLRRLSREDFPRKPGKCVCFVKSNGYQLSRSRGYIFNKIGGSGDEEWAKVPLILRKWAERVRSDRNLDNNSESFDKHVSPLIECSHWLLWFGAILQFLFSTLSLFNECVQSRVNFKIITCNFILIEEEFLFHMVYYTYHLLS